MDWTWLREPFLKAAQGDWEQASYIATTVATLSVAVTAIELLRDRRKMREAKEEENRIEREENRIEREGNYSKLNSEWRRVQLWLADHPKVDVHTGEPKDPDIRIQQKIYYEMLISVFEESFILFYKPEDPEYSRMWNTWADYLRENLVEKNFRDALPVLLSGEDPNFVEYVKKQAEDISRLDVH